MPKLTPDNRTESYNCNEIKGNLDFNVITKKTPYLSDLYIM